MSSGNGQAQGMSKPKTRRNKLQRLLCCVVLGLAAHAAPSVEAAECEQPAKVCDARGAVFRISAFDPVGSAVRVGAKRLITSRHIVADRKTVDLFLPDGTKLTAQVQPSGYAGDAILLIAEGLPDGPHLTAATVQQGASVFTIGADISKRRIRAYAPGKVQLLPAEGKPLSRIHHSAYTQQGNSGGALVNGSGELVGIVASGGEGRFEAVPAAALAVLQADATDEAAQKGAEIGNAIKVCTLNLERLHGQRGLLSDDVAKALATSCRRTENRQYYDLAGQTLSQRRRLETALGLFEASVAQDPNAVNSRLNLVITYHIARQYERELPHLQWLMEHAGDNLQVLRFAIQVGVWTGDKALAERAFAKLKQVNPNAAPAAERFMKSPPPRPAPL
ncbi:MAG: trypsin-like serine protease [Alphaproteobacteria bacterium]|nr:trypsin-like serine protease [Alphaproteobacteria bacterium]